MHASREKVMSRGRSLWKRSRRRNSSPENLSGAHRLVCQFSRSVVSDSLRPHGLQASLSITNFCSLLKLMSIESVMPSNHLCQPLLLLPSIFPSIRGFSSELALHIRGPKYWSFSIHPFSGYAGLISFRIDWCDLLAVKGTQLKSN